MQTYVDLIKRRKENLGNKFDRRQINNFTFKENETELSILQRLCETLYIVHYLAGQHDLPLDDAYSSMLMHNVINKNQANDPVADILTKYREGKLRKAASPIHALMQRVQDVEDIKNKEIQSLKDQRQALATMLEEHGIEILPDKESTGPMGP